MLVNSHSNKATDNLPANNIVAHGADVVIDIPEEPTNPISKGLLQLKKAASYAITATGFSSKMVIILGVGLPISLITALILSEIDEHEYVETVLDSWPVEMLMQGGKYVWTAMLPIGALKAGKLLDTVSTQNHKTAITVGKGLIYLMTALHLAANVSDYMGMKLPHFNAPLFISLPIAVILLGSVIILPPLGAYHCIDLINTYQNRAQLAVKKMQ